MITVVKKIKKSLAFIASLAAVYILGKVFITSNPLISDKLKRNDHQQYWTDNPSQQPVLNDELLQLHQESTFPDDKPCPYLSVRKPIYGSRQANNYNGLTCKPHRPTAESCEKAREIFGETSELPVETCPENKYQVLCNFLHNKTTHKYTLKCDWSICFPRRVSIGAVDGVYGIVTKWISAPSESDIKRLVSTSAKNGFNFVFVRCGSLKQVLRLPPQVRESHVRRKERQKYINVNIILIDSISRPHFYRSMPRTIKALRDIVYDNTTDATVLDFELLQSVSQHTMDNLRPFYSGVTAGVYNEFTSKWRESIQPLGIPVLFEKFKKLGYQTMFQEEGCWYDRWGLMLTDVERYPTPTNLDGFKKRWRDLQNRWKHYFIDDFGMTHFTCQVVHKYTRTNDLDIPSKVCYNGDFITTYFFKYHLDYLKSIRKHNSAPLFHYLHLVTGHTSSGVRIRNDDVGLAEYAREVARDPNTLTIFMSDHGHSRTQYGQTVEGRFELSNPLMFVILPENVARLLGKRQVQLLVENQRRLFTTLDLHQMMMAIHDPEKLKSSDHRINALLSVLPGNRTCESLPLTPMTRCKCEGWNQRVKDNSQRHAWLAEFALGQLNNMIQEQYLNSNKTDGNSRADGGFGTCVRLRGLETRNNVERQDKLYLTTTMDLITESPLQGIEEVFQVMIKTPLIPNEKIAFTELVKFDRHSLYSRYAHCVDSGVDIKLCACVSSSSERSSEEIRKIAIRKVFGAETETKQIDEGGCLFLLTRKQNFSAAYEVTNLCIKTFTFVLTGESYNMLLSAALPMQVLVKPKTIHFLLSATRYVINDSYINIQPSYVLMSNAKAN